jgi:SAM-dependent methyltransferase
VNDVSTCCAPYGNAAELQFDAHKASEELARYQRRGPGPTTRLLRDALVSAGLEQGPLLDVGTGIGALIFELCDRGTVRAVAVDASSSYLAVAKEEAARRGRVEQIEFVHGDFVDLAPGLRAAAVVTMDRVICCYPRFRPLLELALGRAERAFAVSYPRDVWYVRALTVAENVRRRMGGNAFRTFVHSAADMQRLIERAGFRLSSRRRTWIWSIDVYVSARASPVPAVSLCR